MPFADLIRDSTDADAGFPPDLGKGISGYDAWLAIAPDGAAEPCPLCGCDLACRGCYCHEDPGDKSYKAGVAEGAAAEREACARLAESRRLRGQAIADLIRARGTDG